MDDDEAHPILRGGAQGERAAATHDRNARNFKIAFALALCVFCMTFILGTASRPTALGPSSSDTPPLDAEGGGIGHLHSERGDNDGDADDDNAEDDDGYGSEPPPAGFQAHVDLFDAVGLTPRGKNLSTALPALCPAWTPEFTAKFQARCQFWLSEFASWEAKSVKGMGAAVYKCQDEAKCHGLGDRMAGVIGALSVALHEGRPFRLSWQGMSRFFAPCALRSAQANWGQAGKDHGCQAHSTTLCGTLFGMNCEGNHIYENLDRACLSPKTCKQLREHLPNSLNAADVFGCPLRALMEPTAGLLDAQVPLRLNGKVTTMSVAAAAKEMTKYHVISIHFRLGDGFAFFHHGKVSASQANLLRPFRCAQTVQSYLEGRGMDVRVYNASLDDVIPDNDWHKSDDDYKVDGKPVRWFFASDSASMRNVATRLYDKKLIMVDMNPKHIAFSHSHGLLQRTFAEWYLLGLGQHMVANRISTRSGSGDYYTGRVSSFWKTTWTFQINHLFYDADHCRLRTLPMDGTWHNAMECKQTPALHEHLPQPHLEYQRLLNNVSFPHAWVDRGKIHLWG